MPTYTIEQDKEFPVVDAMEHENTYRPMPSKADGKWYVLNDFDETCGGPYESLAELRRAFDVRENTKRKPENGEE